LLIATARTRSRISDANAKTLARCVIGEFAGAPRDLVEAIHSAAAEVFATVFHDGGIGSARPLPDGVGVSG